MSRCTFDQEGGPLTAEVTCAFRQPGSYTLLLWKAGENTIVLEARGNFINDDDDEHALPEPASANEGRVVEFITTVGLVPGEPRYRVVVTIRQDGRELCSDVNEGGSDQPTVTLSQFCELIT